MNKIFGAKAVAEKKPMIGGSAAMMLKSMGVDPQQLDVMAGEVIGAIKSVDQQLRQLNADNAAIMAHFGIPRVIVADEGEKSNATVGEH